jgi:hypothetical protein
MGLGRKFRTYIYLERSKICFTALNARLRKFMTDGLQFVARTLTSPNRRLGGVLFFGNIGIVSAFESRPPNSLKEKPLKCLRTQKECGYL